MNNIRKIIEERLESARNDYLYANNTANIYLRGQIETYQDCLNLFPTPRTEAELLKEFEKLGYEVKQNNGFCLIMINDKTDEVISILKRDTFTISMGYRKYIKDEDYLATFITIQEHKLLNELFEVIFDDK
jgi:hypothetical protein